MVTKPTKPPSPPSSRSSSLSVHLAVVELKQRILTSLSRLSDRDTHQIAVEDLEAVIQTISPDAFSIILNSLYDATNDTTKNKPAVKKEAIRLLAFFCATHTESAASHLTKIITHIVKRLKDPDSGVKDACRESIGHLSFLYLKDSDSGDNNIGSLVLLFVKPLFDAMNEQNKAVQAGAASCMAKMVEMASDPPVLAFQKLCSRICKLLNSPNFMANSALLPVVSRLSQVSAISPQFLEPLLQCINDCLSSSDWSTRKSAADTLIVFALHSSNLIKVKPTSTITMLETCRFDKIKPVRDSITEALQLWNQIAERCEDLKLHNHVEVSEPIKSSRKDLFKLDVKKTKKKTPHLIDKEQNPEFFQRLETRVSGEVEILFPKSSNPQNEVEPGSQSQSKSKSKSNEPVNSEKQDIDPSLKRQDFCNQGNLLGIQRQLLQLERQQNYIMNMLHDFKGGSRDDMATLENRVRGLEKVVDDMARGFSSMSTYSQTYSQPYSQRGRNYTIRKYNVRDRGNLWDHKHGQIRSTRGLTKGVGPGPSTYRAMDGVCNGDMDTAFSEVLSTGDDFLLVKLMDRVGPVVDQLSGDVASEVLHAVAQFLPEASLVDICLSWIQQLLDMISENGADVVGIHVEVKREILVRLNENLSIIEPPQDWEGLMPHQLLLELASAWNINPQQLHK